MKLYIFLLLSILTTVLTTDAQTYNQYDAAGKRHGVWRKMFDGTNTLRYEGTFNHGKETGTFKFYKKSRGKAVLAAIREFNQTAPIAKVTFYNPNGSVVSEGEMDGKTYIGTWKYYQNNSKQLLIVEHYNTKGALHGERTVYYRNGKIAEQNHYNEGMLDGDALWYAENGTLIKKYVYLKGKLHGMAVFYDGVGNLKAKGHYKEDKKQGTWVYYKDGEILETKKF